MKSNVYMFLTSNLYEDAGSYIWNNLFNWWREKP